MFPEQLKKILNLIKKTGDRVVIFDASAPDDSYVVMDFDAYAQAVEGGLGYKIDDTGKVIASGERVKTITPKSGQNNNVSTTDFTGPDSNSENLTGEDLTDKINREISMWKNRENSAYLGEENGRKLGERSGEEGGQKKGWQIPPQVKDKAKEVE